MEKDQIRNRLQEKRGEYKELRKTQEWRKAEQKRERGTSPSVAPRRACDKGGGGKLGR